MMFQPPRFRLGPSATRRQPTAYAVLAATLRWVGSAISLLLLCLAMFAALVLIVIPFATGSQTYSVLTSSMAPKYAPGTFIVVQPTPFDELRVGDVVTYQLHSARPEVVTHRITGFTADQDGNRLLVTKGDNNDLADPNPVMEVQVRGKLLYAVPGAGFLANHLGNSNRGLFVTIAAVGLIGVGIVTMGRDLRGSRRTDDTTAVSA